MAVFEEILVGNFPELMKDVSPKIQEALKNPSQNRINTYIWVSGRNNKQILTIAFFSKIRERAWFQRRRY